MNLFLPLEIHNLVDHVPSFCRSKNKKHCRVHFTCCVYGRAIDGAETNPSFQHLFAAAKSSWSYPLINSFSVLSSIMLTSVTYFKHKHPSKWGKSRHKVVFNFRQCRWRLCLPFLSSSSLNDVVLTHMRNAINDNGCWFPLSFKISTF